MSNQWHGGKGSRPRPFSVDQTTFDTNWDNIFKKEEDRMQVRASHILVQNLQEAQILQNQLSAGGNFDELAIQHSKCPSGKNGGDLGFFGRGAMVKPFEDAAFGLEVGSLSEPVQTQFGYHIVKRTA
jgi:parvulin-like peptidyl-prolyl isomerase